MAARFPGQSHPTQSMTVDISIAACLGTAWISYRFDSKNVAELRQAAVIFAVILRAVAESRILRRPTRPGSCDCAQDDMLGAIALRPSAKFS